MAEFIEVEVAAGWAERQVLVALTLPAGSQVADAIAAAELERRLPGLEVDPARLGIYGRRCGLDRVLESGDRVEVYQALKADPKEVRRQLAELERAGRSRPGRK
jgi:uncharacterized protein